MQEKIEILSADLLNDHRSLADRLWAMKTAMMLTTGWHYLLDWVWIVKQIGDMYGKKILDAGAGLGFIQWYLAEQGADVLSVDRDSRIWLPFHLRHRYHVTGLRPQDEFLSLGEMLNPFNRRVTFKQKAMGFLRSLVGFLGSDNKESVKGKITFYDNDLRFMNEIKDNAFDFVVSVSALEHNNPERLKEVITELLRILKPGGAIIATMSASRDHDWFHESSQGWCYTDKSLRELFGISSQAFSNYVEYNILLEKLRNSDELKRKLSAYYFIKGKGGMPGGRWNPTYQPVGIVKIKEGE